MDIQHMMAQARQMQAQLTDAQDRLRDIEVSASAGGGAVRVTATADMKLTSVAIAPDVCDPTDVEMLQDLVLAAANEALAAAQEAADRQMAAAAGGLDLAGLL